MSVAWRMAATLRYTAATLYHRFSHVLPLSIPVLSVTLLLLLQVLSKKILRLSYNSNKLYYFRKTIPVLLLPPFCVNLRNKIGSASGIHHLLDISSSYSSGNTAAIWNAASSAESGSKFSGSSSGSESHRSARE